LALGDAILKAPKLVIANPKVDAMAFLFTIVIASAAIGPCLRFLSNRSLYWWVAYKIVLAAILLFAGHNY
jgi:undecaprenyl pyrophosphate phosphatase UppP